MKTLLSLLSGCCVLFALGVNAQGYSMSDGNDGYFHSDGSSSMSDGNGGYFHSDGSSSMSDGNGGYFHSDGSSSMSDGNGGFYHFGVDD